MEPGRGLRASAWGRGYAGGDEGAAASRRWRYGEAAIECVPEQTVAARIAGKRGFRCNGTDGRL